MKLLHAAVGSYYQVNALPTNFEQSITLLEQGILAGSTISVVAIAPFQGPMAISHQGTMFSIPAELALEIEVEALA